ncbi:MAG TPA: DUF4835 family protein [Rhodothermales bacterium]|nr:DUF4835 family protein [Rhodothermales bacterium]
MSRTNIVATCLAGLLLFATWLAPKAEAREFNCTVTVNYSQLSGSSYTYLKELEQDVRAYMNNHTWTQDRFQEHERIDCSMQIIIQEALTLTSFRAQFILTSLRPIYGTTQNSRVLQVNDSEWQFDYAQGTPLTFETERYNPLTSVLDFYAYVMLGYDYDTFSELGGTPHFQKARRIAELAQSQNGIGWSSAGDDRNRAALITQLLDPRFVPLRKAYFQYHFGGLDHFVGQTQEARNTVLEVLRSFDELKQNLARQYTIDLFFGTKYQELAAVFLDSPQSSEAYSLLNTVDPSHLTEYNQLVE